MSKGGSNGYASLVKQRAAGTTKRRKLDDYETPAQHTHTLMDLFKLKGKAFEPAAGSGRMAGVLRERGLHVTTTDIKEGKDFLQRTATFPGHVISNPPYRDGLADAFVNHALKIADGSVAMLMESKFLFGQRRSVDLYAETPPSLVIFIPERIYFFEGSGKAAKQISSQFFNHVWLCWPDRKTRLKGGYPQLSAWAPPANDFE